jgi:hypothetical protein
MIDKPVALRHPEGDVSPEETIPGAGFCINLPVNGCGFIIFADLLFLFGITQPGCIAGNQEANNRQHVNDRPDFHSVLNIIYHI